MAEIKAGAIFPFTGSNVTGIKVAFSLRQGNYFNVPEINADGMNLHLQPESFDFRIVEIPLVTNSEPQSEAILAWSNTATVPVHVIHVNRNAPTLTAPKEAKLDAVDPSKALITGILLDDPYDFNMDRVRVDVLIEGGTLTLNPSNLHLADFVTCAGRVLSTWQCTGDGVDDRSLTFTANPSDVGLVLRNMAFTSLTPGGLSVFARLWSLPSSCW